MVSTYVVISTAENLSQTAASSTKAIPEMLQVVLVGLYYIEHEQNSITIFVTNRFL